MSESKIKQLISSGSLICPECKKPVLKFHNYVDMMQSVWDGPGDSGRGRGSSGQSAGASKVTLICDNKGCSWQERTEYWENYLA